MPQGRQHIAYRPWIRPPCLRENAGEPLVIFFEGTFDKNMAIERICALPVAFRLWVANHAIIRGSWPIIGSGPLQPANTVKPIIYNQQAISVGLYLYHSAFAGTNYEPLLPSKNANASNAPQRASRSMWLIA